MVDFELPRPTESRTRTVGSGLWRAHDPDGMAWASSRPKKRTRGPSSRPSHLYSPEPLANRSPAPPSLELPQNNHDRHRRHPSPITRPTRSPRRHHTGAQLDLDIPLARTTHPQVHAHMHTPPPRPPQRHGHSFFPSSLPGAPPILPPPIPAAASPVQQQPPVRAPATPGPLPPEVTGDNQMMPMMNWPALSVGPKGEPREPPTRTTFDRESSLRPRPRPR